VFKLHWLCGAYIDVFTIGACIIECKMTTLILISDFNSLICSDVGPSQNQTHKAKAWILEAKTSINSNNNVAVPRNMNMQW